VSAAPDDIVTSRVTGGAKVEAPALDPAAAEAVTAAAEWRLLSLLMRRPTPVVRAEIAYLSRDVTNAELRALADAAADANESDYLAVLGPGSTISPRIVAYRGMEDPGWILADILGYYGAFAFNAASEDPPDHLSVAADFVAYLQLKEAFARSACDDAARAETSVARERFVRDQLSPVAAPLAERLATAGFAHLAAVARAIAQRVPARELSRAIPVVAPAIDEAACDRCARVVRSGDG
jgi:nitrate reductase assembly molybdenum cofactor insertion protein NarJ